MERELLKGLVDTLHSGHRVETHDVIAEAVHFVLLRPHHFRIDHELFHHAMFTGGIRTATCRKNLAIWIQPVIVIGYDAVEYRVAILASRTGMVEDLIQDHP